MAPALTDARAALRATFGYDDFRPAQVGAVDAVLSGRDALIVLPTGGGKSLCFQVPALVMPGMAVVVSPLISLMADQVQALQRRGVAADFVNSTLEPEDAARRLELVRRGALKLLYLAPERLILPQMLALLRSVALSLLAVDEAHCVSEWGHDFRPSYLRLIDARKALGTPQTVALTATATPQVRAEITRLLGLRSPAEVVGGFDRPNLSFHVQHVANEGHRYQTLRRLLDNREGPAVVYAATRRQVNDVAGILVRTRVAAVGYHGGMAAERRATAQDAFMSGAVPVIVATNAFGMGIDKSDVRLVLHWAMSGSLEDYYQEAGRAGRDGNRSRCVLIYRDGDRGVHDRFREASYPTPSCVRRVAESLVALARRRVHARLDVALIGATCRPSLAAADVNRALDFLREHQLLEVDEASQEFRLRLLAAPLRLACEVASLGGKARAIVDSMTESRDGDWQRRHWSEFGCSAYAFTQAIDELQSRQLVYVDHIPPRFRVAGDGRWNYRLGQSLRLLESLRKSERAKLDAIVGYATTERCRRAYILRYFGDRSYSTSCGRCDNCRADGR